VSIEVLRLKAVSDLQSWTEGGNW